jgi:hypothetical protein
MYKERSYHRRRSSEDDLMLRSLTAPGLILCAGLALVGPSFLRLNQAGAQTTFKADYVMSFARHGSLTKRFVSVKYRKARRS